MVNRSASGAHSEAVKAITSSCSPRIVAAALVHIWLSFLSGREESRRCQLPVAVASQRRSFFVPIWRKGAKGFAGRTRGYDVKLRHSQPGWGHGACDLARLLCTTATGTCSDLKWAARLIVLALRECVRVWVRKHGVRYLIAYATHRYICKRA